MAPVQKFQINVPDSELKRLKQKLELADFPGELEGAGWDYGAPLVDVQRFTKRWINGYEWRTHEKKLNELPQFTTDVEVEGFGSFNMHFVHKPSDAKGAIPLLFVHGWPGSFIEVSKILPLLKDFHVIAPSLPNFGFSSRVGKPGFGLNQYAEACHKVMVALGYDQYVTQGGDWGHMITHAIGLNYPQHCKANHTNMPISRGAEMPDPTKLDAREKKAMERAKWFREEGQGYFHEQSTKPQTLGYGLRDSPVALLAWIYEKLHDWTDNYPWTEDEVLTWISIYYFSTAGPDASTFIYRESTHTQGNISQSLSKPVQCPIALAYFPLELGALPASALEGTLGPVKQVSRFDKGGHFAAYERPEDLAGDVIKFYGKDGPISEVVSGLSKSEH